MAHRWGQLADALALAPSEEALVTAGRYGDVRGRIIHHYRPARPLPPEYWNGNLDYENSRILPCAWITYDGRGEHISLPDAWVRVQVDLHSVREHFESAKPSPRRAGPKAQYDWARAEREIFGRIYRGERREPKFLADVERLFVEWFVADSGDHPSESLIREHAKALFEQLQDDREAGN